MGLLDRSRRHVHRRDRPRAGRVASRRRSSCRKDRLPRRGGRRHARNCSGSRAARRSRPGASARSRWAPPSPPTRSCSARATARCCSSPAGSATRSPSATRRGRKSSPSASSSRRCSTSASSRSTSACSPTARWRARPTSTRRAAALAAAWDDGIRSVAIVFMHAWRFADHEHAVADLARRDGLPAGVGEPRGLAADQAGRPRRHHRRGRLSLADPCALRRRRTGEADLADRCGRHPRLAPPDVHAVVGWAHLGGQVPRQGRDPVGTRRRRGGGGGDGEARRLRQGDRLRHGRHVHRRVALRRRVRARVRDRGRRRQRMRAPMLRDPHGRGGRRLDPRLRAGALPGRAAIGRRRPRTDLLPPRRAAGRDRRQRDGRQDRLPAHFPAIFGETGEEPLDADAVRAAFAALAREIGDGRTAEEVADGFLEHRRRQHGERDQEDLGRARLTTSPSTRSTLRRGRRAARLPRRRHTRHQDGARCTRGRACSPPTAWGSPTSAPSAIAPSMAPLAEGVEPTLAARAAELTAEVVAELGGSGRRRPATSPSLSGRICATTGTDTPLPVTMAETAMGRRAPRLTLSARSPTRSRRRIASGSASSSTTRRIVVESAGSRGGRAAARTSASRALPLSDGTPPRGRRDALLLRRRVARRGGIPPRGPAARAYGRRAGADRRAAPDDRRSSRAGGRRSRRATTSS